MAAPADHTQVKPDYVLALRGPTESFLCPLQANTYGIDFLAFKIRDVSSNKTLFEIDREKDTTVGTMSTPQGVDQETALRSIMYQFPSGFLKHKTVGTQLVFCVGDKPVPGFRMIERHYFRDTLIKSFDFTFGFCIPGSTNSWEAIYDMPELDAALEAEIVANPYETVSDSFYFVNDELVMHNKASYAYNGPES
eukprot:NODE_4687_length_760_cov_67.259084_g4664_i0.p1 GENE.NODE_4687_length_760_cov_67.259084_g4664_i0~~NODE_4687_length_760_cov_67.259084_g4664_i0.p1  ORF type:complete len:194 (-),score=27.78 NODE_4687_length_760_cov_67.259084_g4664_i0:109-690(-)